jgi:hypothetical protein
MTSDCRFELLIGVIAIPVVASVTIGPGLTLAGVTLWLLWPLVLVCWVRSVPRRRPAPSTDLSVPPERPQVVDPARALLDALGDDLTGGQR